MLFIHSFVFLLFFVISVPAFAQYPTGFSAPLDLPEKGWNKTLLLSNGNTALVHIEQTKPINIYIFNKEKVLIATGKELSAHIGIGNLVETEFKGLYEIAGKLVLFMQQPADNKTKLVRIVYSATTGELESEAVVGQLPGMYLSDFTVTKSGNTDEYAVIQYQMIVKPMFRDWNIKLMMYDGHHTKTKEKDFLFFDKSREDIDDLFVIGASFTKENTVNICFSLNRSNNTKHHAVIAFLPEDSDEFVYKVISMSENGIPACAVFTEDNESSKILITVSSAIAFVDGRLTTAPKNVPCLATVDKKTFIVNSLHTYTGIDCTSAACMVAIDSGVAVVSECIPMTSPDGSLFGPITANEINNEGKLSGRKDILKMQNIIQMVYRGEVSHRTEMKTLFTGTNASEYASQFVSFDLRKTKTGYVVIWNAIDNKLRSANPNFDSHLAQAFNYNFTTSLEPDKRFLFPNVALGTNVAIFLESASYDQASDTYAALTSSTVDKKTKLYMSWSKLN